MSFTYTQTGPNPTGTLNLNSAHLKLTFQNKKLIFFNDVSLGGVGSNMVASNTFQAPGFQFENTSSNGLMYASNGIFTSAGSAFNISGNTLSVPNLYVTGNLSVNGMLTTINTQTLVITDPIVQIGANVMDSSNVGLILTSGPSFANVAFGFQPGENAVVLTGTTDSAYGITMTPTSNVDFKVYGNVYAAAFIGDGGLLSNIYSPTTSNLETVTGNGNVTTQFLTIGGLTTVDGAINGLEVHASYGNTSNSAVAVGYNAGDSSQGYRAVAIGTTAGQIHQGSEAVAIGAYAGRTSQANNSIILNASGSDLDGAASGFYVRPIRYVAGGSSNVIGYNTVTGEVFDTGTPGGSPEVQTLQAVTELGASTNQTITFSNALAMNIQGNVEMAASNMNVYSISTLSVAADNVNVTELRATTGEFSANVVVHGNVIVDVGVYTGSLTAVTANVTTLTATGLIVNSNATILGNLEMAAGNINVHSISTTSVSATGNVTASYFIGDGSLLTNVQTSNLETTTLNGAITNQTVTFSNVTTGLIVNSNATILGNLEMAAGNMNVYSISTFSVAADHVNATEILATTASLTGNITGYSNAFLECVFSNTITANTITANNILTDNEIVTGDLTVDGVTTVQILKFTPYSGIDPDTGNASVIATVSGHVITVTATGVMYGSNVVNLSGYVSPITSFNLTVEDSCQLYLYAANVSVNTVSTPTVKYTNSATITNSNVLFHITKIANAGFSVVNAIIV